jgi:RNA exonuclease 4
MCHWVGFRLNNRLHFSESSSGGSTDSNLIVSKSQTLVQEKSSAGLTRALAVDCEMVGCGERGSQSVLARISIVNLIGHCIYDKYVKPTERVTDYRTFVSGIRPKDLVNGEQFKVVQKEVCDMLKGRLLVGHAIKHDLQVLYLSHPRHMIRDTSKYFRFVSDGKTPSLKTLSEKLLGVSVQVREHDSVEDAEATMRLYTLYKRKWESELKTRQRQRHSRQKPEPRAEDSD